MDEFDEFRDETDANEVPQNLKDRVPMAYQWGLGDDVARNQVEEAASEEDKQAFRAAFTGRTKEVTGWLDSFSEQSVHPGAFSNFTSIVEALAERDLWPDRAPPERDTLRTMATIGQTQPRPRFVSLTTTTSPTCGPHPRVIAWLVRAPFRV